MNELEQYKIIASCFDNLNDYKNAIIYYERLLPTNDYKVYGNLARLYASLYDYDKEDEQLYYAEKAYNMNPNDYTNLLNLAIVYDKFDHEKALFTFEKILKLSDNPAKVNKGILFCYGGYLIRKGKFQQGYSLYRNRFIKDIGILPNISNLWEPGISIENKTILLHYEQGYGDTFLFIRFVKDVQKLCKKVMVVVQDDLYDWFKYMDIEIYPERYVSHLKFDYYVMFMDLILLLGIESNNIPYKEGYLDVKKEKIEAHRKNINDNNKFKIGLAYEGDISGLKICRDVPLKCFYSLMGMDVEIYCLQKSDLKNQMKDVPPHYPFYCMGNTFNSWEDTAACMKNMDLVISSDNGILNLAGALGVKTFGLFNKYPESRWFKLQGDVGWYNIKPFQCKKFNYWEPVVEEIRQEISKIIYGRVL